MAYDVGGWFYEPDCKIVYVIKSSSEFGCYLEDPDYDKSFYLSDLGIDALISERCLYYIPHTKDYDEFTKKIFEINLKHDFS